MFGLGKKRSRFGKLLDKEGYTQEELSKASGVSRTTISEICKDEDYIPKYSTVMKIKKGLKKLGVKKDVDQYLGM